MPIAIGTYTDAYTSYAVEFIPQAYHSYRSRHPCL